MNFNLIKIRLKIMFYLIFGKISKKSAKIEFPNNKNIKNIAIFFPSDEQSFRIALYSFRDFNFFDKNINYYFIINQRFENLINLSGPDLIFLNYKRNKVSFCNIKDKEKLMNTSVDVLVDLNVDLNIELCRLISYIDCGYKIGFKSDFSDYFFNFQLDVNNDEIKENNFKRVQEILIQT
jgi:hypothetical protein